MKQLIIALLLCGSAFAKLPYNKPHADLLYHETIAAVQNAHCIRPPKCFSVRLAPLILAFVRDDKYGYHCDSVETRIWFPVKKGFDDVWFSYSLATCAESYYNNKLTPTQFDDVVVLAVNSARAKWAADDRQRAAWSATLK